MFVLSEKLGFLLMKIRVIEIFGNKNLSKCKVFLGDDSEFEEF